MTPEILVALCTARGVALDGSVGRGTSRPTVTAADAALACAGLPREVFDAVMYSWAGDRDARSACKLHLLEWGMDERERQQWPVRVDLADGRRGRFLEALVDLFLLEEQTPSMFRTAPGLRALLVGVHEPVWRAKLAPIYASISHHYGELLSLADAHIWRRSSHGH